jgi:ADP-L-glycero-D-manno-heptose 6-epimerase
MLVVTGAAGFIGSNLLAALHEAGAGVVMGIDTRETEDKKANVANCPDVTWVNPDRTFEALADNIADIAAVIHLGAETSTTATNREAVFAVNVTLSQNLWRFCSKNGTPFIYASSASVYGDGSSGFRCNTSGSAMDAMQPLNLYGESKLAFDRYVAQAIEDGDPRPPQWAGLRFFNVYGPRERHKGSQASVVTQMVPTAARGEPYSLFRSHREGIADGNQARDFIYVGDCLAVILWLLDHQNISGLFNVGTGDARTFLDLAKAVYAAAGQPFRVDWRDTPQSLRAHYQYFTEADLTGLREAGYNNAFTSLEDGVSMTVREYMRDAAL